MTPFDFIKSVTHDKKDLIRDNPDYTQEQAEKLYAAYIVNRGLSLFPDTILHANEMNRLPDLFIDAQYRYYLSALRPNKRFSKWPKLEKNEDIELLQEVYCCNKKIAKYYLKVLTEEQLEQIKKSRLTGGINK